MLFTIKRRQEYDTFQLLFTHFFSLAKLILILIKWGGGWGILLG